MVNLMENISLKLEKEFRKAMEEIMKKHNYMTKTEFIREAIREKMKKLGERDGTRPSVPELKKDLPSYI